MFDFDPSADRKPFNEEAYRRSENWFQKDDPEIKFDEDYLAFLRQHNGGVPRRGIFVTPRGDERLIEEVFPIQDVDNHYAAAGDSEAFHVDLIPFASLFAGDLLCFDFRNPRRGKRPSVVVWLHEESEQDNPVTEKIADNFTEFGKMLYSESRELQ